MRKILLFLFPVIISIVGTIIAMCGKAWILVASESSFHFSLITVNAMFGGFLYTNYSLLIGLLDNELIKKVKNTNIIQKRNSHIMNGVIYAVISAVAGLYIVIIGSGKTEVGNFLYTLALNIEIVYMIFLIMYFLLSLKEMSVLVKHINNSPNKKTKAEIKTIRQTINENVHYE